MTLAELKSKHPEIHAAIVKEVTKHERERVLTWMRNYSADPEGTKTAIENGAPVTQTMRAQALLEELTNAAGSKNKDEGNMAEFMAAVGNNLKRSSDQRRGKGSATAVHRPYQA